MKLATFFAEIGPYLLGQREKDDAVRRLYGEHPPEKDAERLGIYGYFCQSHRRDALESVFSYCQDVIVKLQGEAAWHALIERYFVAHPMRYFEISQNGIHFPPFIVELALTGELPEFLGDLADFEWWEYLTGTRLDDAADDEPGPLRLHSSVDLRPYKYDLLTWIDDDEREPEAPAPRDIVVLFHRDRDLVRQRAAANGLTLMIVKAIVEDVPLDDKLAAMLQIPPPRLQAAVAELREQGVLLGGEA